MSLYSQTHLLVEKNFGLFLYFCLSLGFYPLSSYPIHYTFINFSDQISIMRCVICTHIIRTLKFDARLIHVK
jgi:hypothetical protein